MRIHRSVRQLEGCVNITLRAEYRIRGIGVSRVISDQGSREHVSPDEAGEREGGERREIDVHVVNVGRKHLRLPGSSHHGHLSRVCGAGALIFFSVISVTACYLCCDAQQLISHSAYPPSQY
jgi:hypothetical protein